MKRNKFFIAALALIILFANAAAFRSDVQAASTPQVILDNKLLSFEVPPRIINDRTMLPFRAIAEEMGASVSWDDVTRKVTMFLDNRYVILIINNPIMTYGMFTTDANGTLVIQSSQTYTMDSPPTIVNSRTLVPLRAIAEGLGAVITWIPETFTAVITTNKQAPTPTPSPSPTSEPEVSPGPTPSGEASVFDTTEFFKEISARIAQGMFEDNERFILYYYSSLDSQSAVVVEWIKASSKDLGLLVYGVDIDSPYFDNTGNRLYFIWDYINRSISNIPTMFFVNSKEDVVVSVQPRNERVVDDHMYDFYRTYVRPSATPSASPTSSPVNLNRHWRELEFFNDALDLYSNHNAQFIFVAYNSRDVVSEALLGMMKLAAANAGVDVYAYDFGLQSERRWWGSDQLEKDGRMMAYPAVFFVTATRNNITYIIQPSDLDSLTARIKNF